MTEPDWEILKAEWRAHFGERRAVLPFAEREVMMVSTPVPWNELSERERDALVYEHVFQRSIPHPDVLPHIPHYTTNYDSCRSVEDEIERRGLQDAYAFQVGVLLLEERGKLQPVKEAWSLLYAASDVRCRAALRAMGVEV